MIDDNKRIDHIMIKDESIYICPNGEKTYLVYPLTTFIGDRVFEREQYDDAHPDALIYVNGVLDTIVDDDFQPNFNTYDSYWAVALLKEFLIATNNLQSADTMKQLERMRISNDVSLYCSNKDGAFVYHDCETMRGVLFSIVHFLILNGYKFAYCKHCGKLFATKSLKEQYCKRISPCYNMVVAGKKILSSELTCEQAVRCITQKFRDRKKCIYNNWYVNRDEYFCEILNYECSAHVNAIKAAPTVENICKYQEYLYSDSMPKQERPNRRSNSYMRGVIGK